MIPLRFEVDRLSIANWRKITHFQDIFEHSLKSAKMRNLGFIPKLRSMFRNTLHPLGRKYTESNGTKIDPIHELEKLKIMTKE